MDFCICFGKKYINNVMDIICNRLLSKAKDTELVLIFITTDVKMRFFM